MQAIEIDRVYDIIDAKLCSGQFDAVDVLFDVLPPSELSDDLILTLLTVSLAAKDKLRNRLKFVREAERWFFDNDCPEVMDGLK
jgi:hypothetical protein